VLILENSKKSSVFNYFVVFITCPVEAGGTPVFPLVITPKIVGLKK
jgi:hypothetical protein